MQSSGNKEIFVALIGGLALIITALITGFFITAPVQVTIQATQTAEAKLTPPATSISLPQLTNAPSQQPVSTNTVSAITQTPIPIGTTSVTPPTAIQTPIISRIVGLPFQPTRLFFVITGLVIFFVFVGLLVNENSEIENWAKFLYSIGIISPFLLIWLRFFFDVPSDISTSNVLLITTAYIALILWFENRIYSYVRPRAFPNSEEHRQRKLRRFNPKNFIIFNITTLLPVFIVCFGFTEWSGIQAFLTAIGLSIGVDFYLVYVIFANR